MGPWAQRRSEIEGMTVGEISQDMELTRLDTAAKNRTGHSVIDLKTIRERRADANAIPVIRQLTGNRETLSAATKLARNVPSY